MRLDTFCEHAAVAYTQLLRNDETIETTENPIVRIANLINLFQL